MDISKISSGVMNSLLDNPSSQAQETEGSAKMENQQVEDSQNAVEKRNEEKAEELTKEETEEVAERLSETVQAFNEDLQFEIHEESERMYAKLVDLNKHETIKEFPPEEMLDMLGRIRQAVGMIIDEKI